MGLEFGFIAELPPEYDERIRLQSVPGMAGCIVCHPELPPLIVDPDGSIREVIVTNGASADGTTRPSAAAVAPQPFTNSAAEKHGCHGGDGATLPTAELLK